MTLMPPWLIFVPLAAVLGLLAWIGWRFCYRGVSPASSKPAKAKPSRRVRPSAPRRSTWILIAAPALIVALVAVATLAFARRYALAPLGGAMAGEAQAGLRLNQEVLAPPPPPPPSVFTGIQMFDLETADRDWSHLDPNFAQVVYRLLARMDARGFPMALLEGYRSPERQELLANSHSLVTHARAFQSKHQFGLAADLAPMQNGKLVITGQDPFARDAYAALGQEAEALGLTWGGNWTSLLDFGHVESPEPIRGRIAAAAQGNPQPWHPYSRTE
jgi:peptidoglycan L-alanyl-D-glutamate endopeptidase CwlK